MTQQQFNGLALAEAYNDDALAVIHSIQCLLMLVERHQNHPESHQYLSLIGTSLSRLEYQLKNQAINHEAQNTKLPKP